MNTEGQYPNFDLRTLFESTGVAMLLLDRDLNILLVNSEFVDLMGYEMENIIGSNRWTDLVHPDDLPYILDNARNRDEGRDVPRIYDFRLFDVKREIHNIRMKVNLLPDGNRLVSMLDITDILKEQSGRLEAQQILENLFNDARDAVFISDMDGRIQRMNPAGLTMFGYTLPEILAINARELYKDPSDRDRLVRIITKNGFVKDFEVKLVGKDGRVRDCLITSSIRRDNEGKIIGMSGLMKDVTSRKRSEDRINELNRVLQEITGILRHDLMNNLMIIENATQMSLADWRTDRLEMILASVRRSVSLINRMKEFEASISADEGSNRYAFRSLVDDAVRDSGITYEVIDDVDLELDAGFFTVIQNLVVNAICHGRTDHMDFKVRMDEGRYLIEISDRGRGIPDGLKGRIFEKGFSYGELRGSGTGLFLVKSMVERMGGSVTVHDNEPRGATFRISLPAR